MKSKYYIVYPRKLVEEIKWPDNWGYQCAGMVAPMLEHLLHVKSIGSEFKLIWNDQHRRIIKTENNVTDEEIDDYLKSDCSLLSFKGERTMRRAFKILTRIGAKQLVTVGEYRDVILQQVYYHRNKQFNHDT